MNREYSLGNAAVGFGQFKRGELPAIISNSVALIAGLSKIILFTETSCMY